VRRIRQWGHIRTMVVMFATIGLVIPAISLVGSAFTGDVSDSVGVLWPTSILLMAGHPGDPWWIDALVWSFAIFTNMVLYGIGGWIIGGVWQMIDDLRTGE
jgi:hypothetical protein